MKFRMEQLKLVTHHQRHRAHRNVDVDERNEQQNNALKTKIKFKIRYIHIEIRNSFTNLNIYENKKPTTTNQCDLCDIAAATL